MYNQTYTQTVYVHIIIYPFFVYESYEVCISLIYELYTRRISIVFHGYLEDYKKVQIIKIEDRMNKWVL